MPLVLQMDYELVDYVSQLREGILEAYTGIVTGFKNTDKGKHSRIRCIFLEFALTPLCSARAAPLRSIHPRIDPTVSCGRGAARICSSVVDGPCRRPW